MASRAHEAQYRKFVAGVLNDPRVCLDARTLFLMLYGFANPDGSCCYPSAETLAEKSGHGRKWVFATLKILREAGWISSVTVPGKEGRVNLYLFNWAEVGHFPLPQNPPKRRGGRPQKDTTRSYPKGDATYSNTKDHADREESPFRE